MCQNHAGLNLPAIDALDIMTFYDATSALWNKIGEPLYIGCPIGLCGPIGPSGSANPEPYNERIAYLGGAIGNLRQTINLLEKVLEYEKEK